ncbi:hypothetical protein WMY93_004383 [Mugilogobius chulae]|uniref:Uncharacterized protein n=1 Tax=Mugilogobius chulae TaxID=88201 RepID=A0AAW0PNI9_9GOBI
MVFVRCDPIRISVEAAGINARPVWTDAHLERRDSQVSISGSSKALILVMLTPYRTQTNSIDSSPPPGKDGDSEERKENRMPSNSMKPTLPGPHNAPGHE